MIYRVFMTDGDYVVIDADSPEEAILKLRDAGLEPVKVAVLFLATGAAHASDQLPEHMLGRWCADFLITTKSLEVFIAAAP